MPGVCLCHKEIDRFPSSSTAPKSEILGRKVIKTRTLFPNEEAAKKLIYLAIMNFTASWKRATPKWSAAMPQFALLFGERFTGVME